MTLRDLAPVWAAVEGGEGRLHELRARELDEIRVEGRPAYVAIDWEQHRHLLIPMSAAARAWGGDRGTGVRMAERDLVGDDGTRRYLDVMCLKPHLNGLFDILAGEMLDRARVASLVDVPAVCRAVLGRWRELLSESGAELPTSVLCGAWGELWFVRELLRRGAEWSGLWGGPTGAPHDIVGAGGRHLEVKSTLVRGPLVVEIHGIHQLDIPAGGTLHLGVLRLTQDPDGESVEELVRSCHAAGADGGELLRLLARIGIAASAVEFSEIRYSVAEARLYVIDALFPRIVPSTFAAGGPPSGVGDVRYVVDLTGDPPRTLDPMAFDDVLTGMARG